MKKFKFLSTFNGRSSQEDPLKSFRFLVEIDGFARAGFLKCTMPKATTEVIKYREGGANSTPSKSPGLTEFGDITLERGTILAAGRGDEDFLNWYTQVFDVSVQGPGASPNFRRTLDLVELDREGNEARRWRIEQAWPMEFRPGSDKDALASDNNIEGIILVNEGFSKVT